MYRKAVNAILLKSVGNKLLLIHHVFCKGALHAQGVSPAFLFSLYMALCHALKFAVKAVYYDKTVACGYTLEKLQLTLKNRYRRYLRIEENQTSALHVTVNHQTELLRVALAILRVKSIQLLHNTVELRFACSRRQKAYALGTV